MDLHLFSHINYFIQKKYNACNCLDALDCQSYASVIEMAGIVVEHYAQLNSIINLFFPTTKLSQVLSGL